MATIQIGPNNLPEQDSHDIRIYPNPAGDHFYLDIPGEGEGTYEIVSADGKTVLRGFTSGHLTWVNTSTLAPGVYLVKLNLDQMLIPLRIIIE